MKGLTEGSHGSGLFVESRPGAEGDDIADVCCLPVGSGACAGRLRIEVVIADTVRDSTRILDGVRCRQCGAFYLFDPASRKLILR